MTCAMFPKPSTSASGESFWRTAWYAAVVARLFSGGALRKLIVRLTAASELPRMNTSPATPYVSCCSSLLAPLSSAARMWMSFTPS